MNPGNEELSEDLSYDNENFWSDKETSSNQEEIKHGESSTKKNNNTAIINRTFSVVVVIAVISVITFVLYIKKTWPKFIQWKYWRWINWAWILKKKNNIIINLFVIYSSIYLAFIYRFIWHLSFNLLIIYYSIYLSFFLQFICILFFKDGVNIKSLRHFLQNIFWVY